MSALEGMLLRTVRDMVRAAHEAGWREAEKHHGVRPRVADRHAMRASVERLSEQVMRELTEEAHRG